MKTTSKTKTRVVDIKKKLLLNENENKKIPLDKDIPLKEIPIGPFLDDNLSDEENEDDDDYSDEEYEDEDLSEVDDDEEVMTECPDYCKCTGQYASATTATYVSNRIIM